MAKARQKRQKMGYGLKINRSGEPGLKNWERVGYLFASKYQAEKYLKRVHPSVKKSTIQAIRLNVEPIIASTKNNSQERE